MSQPRLSNRTILALAKVVSECFEYLVGTGPGGSLRSNPRPDLLAEFLFVEEFPPRLIEKAQHMSAWPGNIKSFVLELMPPPSHTNRVPTPEQQQSQPLLLKLAGAILRYAGSEETLLKPSQRSINRLVARLELDGYEIRDGHAIPREENVFDVEEQAGTLDCLFNELGLEGRDQFVNDLKLTDEHYEKEMWGDSIKHARDVLDLALLGVARAHAVANGHNLPRRAQNGNVRAHLKQHGIVTHEENEFLFALYGLLSVQGGHANMSEREHARINRQHALTAVHFILLRWEAMKP
jgi:hypothetical protein